MERRRLIYCVSRAHLELHTAPFHRDFRRPPISKDPLGGAEVTTTAWRRMGRRCGHRPTERRNGEPKWSLTATVLIPTYSTVQTFWRPAVRDPDHGQNTSPTARRNEQVLVQIIEPNFGDMLFMVHRGCLATQAWISVIKNFGPSSWFGP